MRLLRSINPRAFALPTVAAAVVAVVGLVFAKSQPSIQQPAKTTSSVTDAKTVKVAIKNYMYMPSKLTVRAGTKIVVTNDDQTAHTLTARSGAFDSGTIQPGKTMTFTARTVGTFAFYCQFHAFMAGTLTVVR